MTSAPLSPRIERLLLWKMAQGEAALDTVKPEELSKVGQAVHAAIAQLARSGGLPASLATVQLAAVESHGAEPADVHAFIQRVARTGEGLSAADPTDVLQSVRDQRLGQELTNRVWEQLRTGHLDIGDLIALLVRERRASSLTTAEALMADGIPPEVSGPPFPSLPRTSRAAGGIHGRIVIGGLPNIGKTPLAWQIALHYGAKGKRPVLWYDLDDTGEQAILRRNYEIYQDRAKAAEAVRSFYLRDSIMTLDQDLNAVGPALVVVDSVQTLPIGLAKDRRMSLDTWLARFKAVTKRGHAVLLVSEVSRANYGEARMSAFKETGAIEYASTFGVQLLADDEDLTELHIVKNRHRPKKKGETFGHVVNLTPKPGKNWIVQENEVYEEDE